MAAMVRPKDFNADDDASRSLYRHLYKKSFSRKISVWLNESFSAYVDFFFAELNKCCSLCRASGLGFTAVEVIVDSDRYVATLKKKSTFAQTI